jgi:hypothetical protein
MGRRFELLCTSTDENNGDAQIMEKEGRKKEG